MTYTKDNINGLRFQYKGEGVIFTIKIRKAGVDNVFWDRGSDHYNIPAMLEFLSGGTWIPIEVPVSETYEIY